MGSVQGFGGWHEGCRHMRGIVFGSGFVEFGVGGAVDAAHDGDSGDFRVLLTLTARWRMASARGGGRGCATF